MRLLLIRHGESPDNVRGVLASHLPGPSLTDLGRQQAEAVADVLASEPIDAVFSSEATRARETAAPLASRLGIGVTVVPGLHEITCGDFEGRGDEAAQRGYLGTIMSWWADPSRRISGGESGDEFLARFWGAINTIAATGVETAAVFSHAGSIRTWSSSQSLNLDQPFSETHGLANTGIVRLDGDPTNGFTVTHWQEDAVSGAPVRGPIAQDPAGAVR
jgi:broad specificity phosphatase PhoE